MVSPIYASESRNLKHYQNEAFKIGLKKGHILFLSESETFGIWDSKLLKPHREKLVETSSAYIQLQRS